MNLFVFIFLLGVVTPYCTACSHFICRRIDPVYHIPWDSTNSSNLNFTAGDIISCNINYIGSHIFLASSNSDVIYIEGDTEKMPFKTRIAEKPFKLVTTAGGECGVITDSYDRRYAGECKGTPFQTEEILRRARTSLGKYVQMFTHFDNLRCNSEHWVSAWRYGTSWTLQIRREIFNKFKSDNCEAPGEAKCYTPTDFTYE